MQHEILLGLTTTPKSDWRGKVEEIKKFGIKRIALFPTFLNIKKRRELYALLEHIEGLEIPHVHLRGQDMEQWEMDLFENKYNTQVYNVHDGKVNEVLEKYKHKIFVENRYKPFLEKYLEGFAGLCIDFSHMADGRKRKNSKLDPLSDELILNYKVGCCHVSALNTNKFNIFNYILGFDRHFYKNLNQLDYIGQYQQYLPEYISLELENTFEEQLKAKEYLETKILNYNQ